MTVMSVGCANLSSTVRSSAKARSRPQDFAPRRHAIKRHGDVVPAASRVHLAGQLSSGGFFEQAFDEEEQILATCHRSAPMRCGSDPARGARQQFALFFAGQQPATCQHARVGIVDLQQRVQEILLSVFEVMGKDGFGVNRRGKGIGHPVPS